MRLRLLPFLAVALVAWAQLVHCKRTIVSEDSLDGFQDESSGDQAISSSPQAVRGNQIDVNTGRRLQEDTFLSGIPAPPPVRVHGPPSRQSRPGVRLRVAGSQVEAAHPPYIPQRLSSIQGVPTDITPAAQANAPGPHPMLATVRAREAQKVRGKLRRSRDEDSEAAQTLEDEPRRRPDTPMPPQRVEGEGRRTMILRSDSRAKKIRPEEAGSSSYMVERAGTPSARMIEVPIRQAAIIPAVALGDQVPPSSRAVAPGESASDAFQLAQSRRAAAPAGNEPDSFLSSLFQHYHSFPQPAGFNTRPAPFYVNGLRYGHFPATQPLRDLLAFPYGDPHAGSASVLTPEDVRWTFGQVAHRDRAFRMARSRSYTLDLRRAMARDAQRLYEMEANHLRSGIHGRSELPLHTSDEWRHWVALNGPNALFSQLEPARLGGEFDPNLLNAQHQLAVRLQTSDLARANAIPLQGEQEKFAATSLVAMWTSAKDEALRMGGLGPVI